LALVSYLVLHAWAQPVPIKAVQPSQVGSLITQTIYQTMTSVGQYLVPFFCLCGAATSGWKQHQRRTLAAQVTHSKAADALNGMSWQQFELLVGEAFRQQGYRVVELGGGGPDGGVDLVLHRHGEKHFVQCKQWRAYRVGVDVVRELYGVMAAQGAASGFVVTSGQFTAEASQFADGRNIHLIDGPKLNEWLKRAQRATSAASAPASNVIPLRPKQADAAPQLKRVTPRPVAPSPTASPSCPVCGTAMVLRTAKQGTQAGSQFWGCSHFPSCRGTRVAQ